jgi:indole-3-glycerol phosphate synthase
MAKQKQHILDRIVAAIRQDEAEAFAAFSADYFTLDRRQPPNSLVDRLRRQFGVIAEVKKASPSKGVIREPFDHLVIAAAYEKAGAAVLSVLTEKNFFQGAKRYLREIKDNTALPVLRKDFIIHPMQIYESYNLGADAVLLIAACLGDEDLSRLYKAATGLGMEVLFEVHDLAELRRILPLKPEMIGVNNRDLKTFRVDIAVSLKLKKHIPENIVAVAESGIKTRADVRRLQQAGFSGVLVGESLLRAVDPGVALCKLING